MLSLRRLTFVFVVLLAGGLIGPSSTSALQRWRDPFKRQLVGTSTILRQPVYKVAFAFNRRDVMNVSSEGVYYKSGLFTAYTIDELAEKVDGRPDTIPAYQDAEITNLEFDDESVKVKFKTATATGAITFHLSKRLRDFATVEDFESEFLPLYRQFFARSRQEILAEHPEWPADVVETLDRGEVDLGMEQEMVLYALGEPVEKRSRLTAEGRVEEWTYKIGVTGAKIVVFQDGKVAAIEEIGG